MTTLASLIRDILGRISEYKLSLESSSSSLNIAIEISKRTMLHEGNVPIAGIRGPPGTGKTKIMEGLINDADVINELYNSGYKFIYIAPTNELVTSGFSRALIPIVKALQALEGADIDKILSKIRIYGSAIPRPYLNDNDLKALRNKYAVDKETLKKMTSGGIDDALFIFTTDYQRISSRMRGSGYRFALFIDEASKMPFYLPFNTISDAELRALAQGNLGIIHSLIIVGDDRQAVAVGPEYQGYGKSLLALPKVEEILRNLDPNQFMTLDKTLRLPDPTQQPIYHGFYSDLGIQLKASEDAKVRLGKYLKEVSWGENLNRCRLYASDYLWSMVLKSIETALSSLVPVIMVNVKNPIHAGEYFEPTRVRLAAYYAVLLRCLLGNNVGISVIGPYRDLVDYSKIYLRKVGGTIIPSVRFLTVQSMLGNEDDIIISLLGKEWSISKSDDEGVTIYFREPENLNVQLSRHRLMLIVIGDLQGLRNSAASIARRGGLRGLVGEAPRIRMTMDSLLGLAGISTRENKQIRGLKSFEEGEHAIFMKVDL